MNSGFNTSSEKKIGVTIFASGKGTNAENLIRYFDQHPIIKINLIVCNNPQAGVCKVAEKHEIPIKFLLQKAEETAEEFIAFLRKYDTDYILLAGYLKLLDPLLVKAFRHRILNIHPALLPKYGGRGMYGRYVHEKVIENKEKETGITIHEVNELYDQGAIVFQKSIPVFREDTVETIEQKVRQMEFEFFPGVIEKYILEKEKR
ncbi:MAG: phosphoribosylglycinamide formyltransferase [Chitinophagales bacterium]